MCCGPRGRRGRRSSLFPHAFLCEDTRSAATAELEADAVPPVEQDSLPVEPESLPVEEERLPVEPSRSVRSQARLPVARAESLIERTPRLCLRENRRFRPQKLATTYRAASHSIWDSRRPCRRQQRSVGERRNRGFAVSVRSTFQVGRPRREFAMPEPSL